MPSIACGGAIRYPLPLASLPWRRRRCGQTSLPFRAQRLEHQCHPKTPRRSALLLLLSLPAALAHSPPAAAISFGIPGPKQWLKDQQKKSAKFLLAPIEASRERLCNAYLVLESMDSRSNAEDPGEIRKLLNSAARDCVPQDRSSLIAFQAGTGVEVCTFRLVLKNASSLLDDRDPVKLGAESLLRDLIRSFSSTSALIEDSTFQLASERQKVKDGILDTISSLDKFEQGVKDCLGI